MLLSDTVKWNFINEIQANELAKKEYKRINKEIPNLLLQSEIFNFMPLSYEDDSGYSCYLGLKKYPNVYAIFECTPENITSSVIFQFYTDEEHFISYGLPLVYFFELIHFNDSDINFIEDFFHDCIKKIVGDIETDRFYISKDISFEKNDAEKFLMNGGFCTFYSIIDDDSFKFDAENKTCFATIKTTYFELNPLQRKLILLWLSDKNGKEKYILKK